MSHHSHDDENANDSAEQMDNTAEHWRQGLEGTDAERPAAEVARGAERGAEQPDFGIEGN